MATEHAEAAEPDEAPGIDDSFDHGGSTYRVDARMEPHRPKGGTVGEVT